MWNWVLYTSWFVQANWPSETPFGFRDTSLYMYGGVYFLSAPQGMSQSTPKISFLHRPDKGIVDQHSALLHTSPKSASTCHESLPQRLHFIQNLGKTLGRRGPGSLWGTLREGCRERERARVWASICRFRHACMVNGFLSLSLFIYILRSHLPSIILCSHLPSILKRDIHNGKFVRRPIYQRALQDFHRYN